MELNHLRYFHEVARAGSFTHAARTLRVSQPAISKIVRGLEEREGVRLFERNRRGITLTDEGRLFFARCEAIFGEVRALREDLATSRHEVAGDLALGASDNLCNYVLPALLSEFWQRHPKVRVKLFNGTSEAIQHELRAGRAELGLFFAPTPARDRQLRSEPLAFVEFALVCSAKNVRLRGGRFDPARLREFYFIGSRREDYAQPFPALKMLRSIGVEPNLFFETNSQETQKRMALREYGFTLLPHYMVKAELAKGTLRRIRTPEKLGTEVHLVQRQARALSRPAALLADELRKGFKSRLM
jgi:DNA-binding transcriptional LysR family regulator